MLPWANDGIFVTPNCAVDLVLIKASDIRAGSGAETGRRSDLIGTSEEVICPPCCCRYGQQAFRSTQFGGRRPTCSDIRGRSRDTAYSNFLRYARKKPAGRINTVQITDTARPPRRARASGASASLPSPS